MLLIKILIVTLAGPSNLTLIIKFINDYKKN